MSVLKLNPQVGDKFVGRPEDMGLLMEIIGFRDEQVMAMTTKNDVSLLIPFKEWNRYVSTGIIKVAPKSKEA